MKNDTYNTLSDVDKRAFYNVNSLVDIHIIVYIGIINWCAIMEKNIKKNSRLICSCNNYTPTGERDPVMDFYRCKCGGWMSRIRLVESRCIKEKSPVIACNRVLE